MFILNKNILILRFLRQEYFDKLLNIQLNFIYILVTSITSYL